MPIVEKIESLRGENDEVIAYIRFENQYCEIHIENSYLLANEAETKILAVYNTCVEFVKWYNQQYK